VTSSGRGRLANLTLAGASVLFTLLGVEAAFHLLHVPVGTVQINRRTVRHSANPRLGFELRPGAAIRAEVDYRINSQGMRERELPVAKPAGTRRIGVIGDSIAFGYWVAEDDAFPRQLERLLSSAAGERIEVLDFGVPGYNLPQEIELLRERALPFSPDLVVLALCLNDLEGPESYEYGLVQDRATRSNTWTGWSYEWLLDRSRLLAWLEYRRAEMEARREYVRLRDRSQTALYAESLEGQQRALAAHFDALAVVLASAGQVPALVAIFPGLGQPFARYPYQEFHRIASEAARSSGFTVVDLLDCYRAYDFRDVRVDIVHPSPLGHHVAADAIAEALCTMSWPCPPSTHRCTEHRPSEFPRVRGY
jgi:lysophospholipase L1-like esterase